MRHQLGRTTRSMPRGMGTRWKTRLRSGVAALEFALLAPVLLSTLAGLYDLTTAFIAWKHVALAAQAIAEISTSLAATATSTNQLNLTQANQATSAVYAYLPDTLNPTPPAFGVTLSSIVMVPTVATCISSCTYTAHVAWSGNYQGSAPHRPCDAKAGVSSMSFVPDGSSPTPNTLPTDLQSAPLPILIVDVNYTFSPLFYTFITGPIQMSQSAYFSPRIGLASNWVQYYAAGAPDTTRLCPTYPSATSPT